MPTYTYRCTTCGHVFELFQPISAAPLQECIETVCAQPNRSGRGKVERVITGGAGFIFNGTGFYITDYKRAGSKKESSPSSSSQSCSSGSCSCASSDE